jgi:hypothetical protein
MTLEEAKKILESEGFDLLKTDKLGSGTVSEAFTEYENPEICEAMQTVYCAGYKICMFSWRFDERKARLKMECEKNTKAPGPGEEQPEEGNPALKESASQFNDALLDEQAKKIEELTEENERLKDQVAVLYECKENNEKYNLKQIKRLGKEISKLNGIIHDKNEVIADLGKELKAKKALVDHISKIRDSAKINLNLREKECEKLKDKLEEKDAVLSDVAEELRLSKIREKNLTEVCQKYMKENEELREKVAEKTKLVEMVRKGSKEYCEYGIAAEKMIQKMAKDIVDDRPVSPKDYEQYRLWAKGYRFNPQLPNFSEEEEKKLSLFRDDSVGAVTNQKDCSSAKDTHPTEDNPEQIEKDEILERVRNALEDGRTVFIGYDKAEEGGDHSAIIAQCCKNIAISKDEAEIIERCTKNGTELHYSEKDGFTYTNMFGDEMPIICLRGMCQVFTDEEIKNMKK